MKVTIPDDLKKEVPQTTWGKILTATPVVMAVVATMLAGLASSEMTRAQYDRALGAQQQSKAGDQWSFFQAKRLRSALQRNNVDILKAAGVEVRSADPATLRAEAGALAAEDDAAKKAKTEIIDLLDSDTGKKMLTALGAGTLPMTKTIAAMDDNLRHAIDGLEKGISDEEMDTRLVAVSNVQLEEALHQGWENTRAFDADTKPMNQLIDRVDNLLSKAAGASQLNRDFAIARLHFSEMRYDGESSLNQTIAYLYELEVRKSNISAAHHHSRSKKFFFGMLAAQMAVIVATFAIAARQRNVLWGIAAAAGIVAVGLAIYVYLAG